MALAACRDTRFTGYPLTSRVLQHPRSDRTSREVGPWVRPNGLVVLLGARVGQEAFHVLAVVHQFVNGVRREPLE